MSDAATTPGISRRAWIMIITGALIVTLSMGVRQAFGLFLRPIGLDLEIDRQTFGLVIAAQNLIFGLAMPFVGAWADKIGAGRIAVGGALIYIAGLAIAAASAGALGLMIGFGALTGIAMAGVTFVVVLGAVGRAVQPHERTLAFGIVTAGGSLGQFLVVPAAQGLLDAYDWRATLVILAALVALIIPLALGVAGKPPATDSEGRPAPEASARGGRRRPFLLAAERRLLRLRLPHRLRRHPPARLYPRPGPLAPASAPRPSPSSACSTSPGPGSGASGARRAPRSRCWPCSTPCAAWP